MPADPKPLFRPDVLRARLQNFTLPSHIEECRPLLHRWAALLASRNAEQLNEQQLLPDFLTEFFGRVLGYTGPASGLDRYTLSREQHVQVGGKFADAVLGAFTADQESFVVAVEGKGPKDPLDRPFAGRPMSAVDQGYRYAINLPCDWIVITSMRETRLYFKGADQNTFERFETIKLAADESLLLRFVFLLGADRVVPESGKCHLYELRTASEKLGREITKEFYVTYANIRQDAYELLCAANPGVPRHDVLRCAQKLLDRVLFVAFCEDRGLLPQDSIDKAYTHRDPYQPRPIWENFRGLFRAINEGQPALDIPAYNGGLFATDALLDGLTVGDNVCTHFRNLSNYDYRNAADAAEGGVDEGAGTLIDVDILGHIFEQSITDLEVLRNELAGLTETVSIEKHKSRRKKEGAFYTPAFITRYIIEQALGGVLRDRFEHLRLEHAEQAKGTAKSSLADPTTYDLAALKKPQREALIRFWEAWQDELKTVRVLDPACGSGAFLIEAFDQLHSTYQQSNDRLEELRGYRTLFDLDREILKNNLYGVDLNDEAVEICRLSLWIKTAARGKVLTSLDHSIRVGNSVVDDPAVHPRAFNWQSEFPEVFAARGFDVVVGNPPYVRQELLGPIKSYLQSHFRTFHGMADLYVYFYELGLRVLKPGGRLSFVVTNKWMKAGYAEPLRKFFTEAGWIESVVDFGHAKQIFEQADVFPSIIVVRQPTNEVKPKTARLCTIPREQLRIDDLSRQIQEHGTELPLAQLAGQAWQLESSGVNRLLQKIRQVGIPLSEFAGSPPFRGILTGFNNAFVVSTTTKNTLVEEDPRCAAVLRPFVRGQDIDRWSPEWGGLWMIAIDSSSDHAWPWTNADKPEVIFQTTFPPIYDRFKPLEQSLRKRQDQGKYWWELRSCAYWNEFTSPKLYYQEIQYHPSYGLDEKGMLGNNKTYFIPSNDLYLLAVLNSPLMWWHNWRTLPHMKDEALFPARFLMESLPIAEPCNAIKAAVTESTGSVIEITDQIRNARRMFLDWLGIEYDIRKPTNRLQTPWSLDSDELVSEVKKLRGKKHPLSAAALKSLRDEYVRTIEPARALAAEAATLEQRISDLVNEAYGLTPQEVDLMWETAPPRMPIPAPRPRG